ncbi:MAG: SOS response-associated peptidase [Actinomycetes bacterium]
MCGRYAASSNPDDLVEEFEVDRLATTGPLEPDFNVAPTKPVPVVLVRPARGPTADGRPAREHPERQLRVVRWGLVPSWAKDPSGAGRMINARVETVAEKPAFRRAFAARRCILPADGYYEWYAPRRQPFFIRPRDGGVLAMAGLYEMWRDPTRAAEDPEAWLWTAAVLTTAAQDDLGHLHDRMPLVVGRHQRDAWLDPAAEDPRGLLDMLAPAAPGWLEAYPVSTAVGDVANNGRHLVEPLPADGGTEETAETDQPTLF